MELNELRTLLKNFRNLGASSLLEQEKEYHRKIEKIKREHGRKKLQLEILDSEIKELTEDTHDKDLIENLHVELIRAKTQDKKIIRDIDKLQALNVSRIKVDVSERDKKRLRDNRTKLDLVNRQTGCTVMNDGNVIMSDHESNLKLIQLNKNLPKEINRETLWKNIEECSPLSNVWQDVFNI